MAIVAAAARPRVRLGIHVNVACGFSVVAAMDLPSNAPAQPQDLASWATAGWVIEFVHGNSDRGGYIRLRKGALVNQAQALLGIGKDGKKFYVAARLVWGADPPDDWKDPQNWLQAGWTITDATGNLEHGAFLILTKSIDASAQ